MKIYILTILLIQCLGSIWAQTTINLEDSCSQYYDSLNNRIIYQIVDKMPTYKGGNDSIKIIIHNNLKWEPCINCQIQGTVLVEFIIEPDGTLTNKGIVRSFDNSECCNANQEALRALNYLNNWIPGSCNGKIVPVRFVIPIKFELK